MRNGRRNKTYVKRLALFLALAFLLSSAGIPVVGAESEEYASVPISSISANSNRGNDNDITMAIDGNINTIWHSDWNNKFKKDEQKYEVVLDLGAVREISRLTYAPRQSDQNGTCYMYSIYTGENSEAIDNKVAVGSFEYSDNLCKDIQTVTFEKTNARYIKFVYEDSLVNGGGVSGENGYMASAAEFYVSVYTGAGSPVAEARDAFEAFADTILNINDDSLRLALLEEYRAFKNNVDYAYYSAEALNRERISLQDKLEAYTNMDADLQKLIDSGVNKAYFERLKACADEQRDFVVEQIEKFNRTGSELDPMIEKDLELQLPMSAEDENIPLIDRLKTAYERARALIEGEPGKYIMLEELCGYIDGGTKFGLDADSCEYLVSNINFALSNIEKINSGELSTSISPIKADTVWLDTLGSAISANAGQIIVGGDGKYYWYGEDNKFGGSLRTGVSCYSSDDLVNWKYEGLAFEAFDTELNKTFTETMLSDSILGTEGRIERPKVMYNSKNDTYVMWMHLENGGGYQLSAAGVAVSEDGPTGPFRWLGCGYPVWDKSATYNGTEKQTYRDMNVFVDDDGEGYIFYASEGNPTMYVARLNDDYTWIDVEGLESGVDYVVPKMTEISSAGVDYDFPSYTATQMKYDRKTLKNENGRWSRAICQIQDNGYVWEAYAQREAPAPIKYNGTYYLVTSGCSGWWPNIIIALKADDVLGPYVFDRDENAVLYEKSDAERLSMMVGTSDNYDPYNKENSTAQTGFRSQSTCILQLPDGSLMYMGDRWKGGDYNDGGKGPNGALIKRSTYVWMPITFEDGKMTARWKDNWPLLSESCDVSGMSEIDLSGADISGAEPTWDAKNSVDKVFDDDLNTFYDAHGDTGYIEIDLNGTYAIDAISYAPRQQYDFRMYGGEFSGYNPDTDSWEVLFNVLTTPTYGYTNIGSDKFASGDKEYSKIRYRIDRSISSSHCNIAEIKIYGDPIEYKIKSVTGAEVSIYAKEGGGATAYAALYNENNVLTDFDLVRIDQAGERAYRFAFEPDIIYIWDDNMRPYDKWDKATEETRPTPSPAPTSEPTAEPTLEPSAAPTSEPTASPTAIPTAEPTSEPTAEPTLEPSAAPTSEPTASPTAIPTAEPTSEPTAEPTLEPSAAPTSEPTASPTAIPTAEPTSEPTLEPTPSPSATPTETPDIGTVDDVFWAYHGETGADKPETLKYTVELNGAELSGAYVSDYKSLANLESWPEGESVLERIFGFDRNESIGTMASYSGLDNGDNAGYNGSAILTVQSGESGYYRTYILCTMSNGYKNRKFEITNQSANTSAITSFMSDRRFNSDDSSKHLRIATAVTQIVEGENKLKLQAPSGMQAPEFIAIAFEKIEPAEIGSAYWVDYISDGPLMTYQGTSGGPSAGNFGSVINYESNADLLDMIGLSEGDAFSASIYCGALGANENNANAWNGYADFYINAPEAGTYNINYFCSGNTNRDFRVTNLSNNDDSAVTTNKTSQTETDPWVITNANGSSKVNVLTASIYLNEGLNVLRSSSGTSAGSPNLIGVMVARGS